MIHNQTIHKTSEATGILPTRNSDAKPITVIGTDKIRAGFDETCIAQAQNSREAPGVTDLILNPDAHAGYGAPVGCVMVSPTHIYPGPVGVDIKCSMSLLQLDVPEDAIADKRIRRALIEAICERTPTGAGRGQRHAGKSRHVNLDLGRKIITRGATPEILTELGIPFDWAMRCEDNAHFGHDGNVSTLEDRLDRMERGGYHNRLSGKISQLGSYGGGNHFGEAEIVEIANTPEARKAADVFGLKNNHVAFL